MNKNNIISLLILIAFNVFNSNAQQTEFVLKSGTPIQLETSQPVDSKHNLGQSSVDFRVKFDVKVNDKTVIQAGTIAKGQVVMAQGAKGCGKGGLIEIKALNVYTIDGQLVQLYSSNIRREGENKKALAWGLSVGGCFIISPLSFLFLLIKGEEGVIPGGTAVDAQSTNNITIKTQ
jgi:hypothetical protein